jgi:hypothetical protein
MRTENGFVSSPAQGRSTSMDYSPYGPFPTEDFQFNPRTGRYTSFISFGSTILFNTYPATRYLDYLLPPEYAIGNVVFPNHPDHVKDIYNYLMSYDPAVNNSLPYGLATPNRQGFGWEADFDFLHGGIRPSVYGSLLAQIEGDQYEAVNSIPGSVSQDPLAPDVYTELGGGVRLDLVPMFNLPVGLVGGYRIEDTNNGQWVAFSSTLVDGGLELAPFPKTSFSFGYRHLDANGTLFRQFVDTDLPVHEPPGVNTAEIVWQQESFILPPPGQLEFQEEADTMGGGFVYQFTSRVSLSMNYSSQWVHNALGGYTSLWASKMVTKITNAYPRETWRSLQNDEGYAKFIVKF